MKRGDVLLVVDPHGEQVSDLFAFAADNPDCALSSRRTIDYASKIYLTTGDVLWSNDSRPMFTILRDDVRRHDFLLTHDYRSQAIVDPAVLNVCVFCK